MQKLRICHFRELDENSSRKFQIPENREGFAIRYQGRVFAYFNECAHISLPLDWDDNDFFSHDFAFLACKNHGAMFSPDTGKCITGPCPGASLKKIETIEEDGILFGIIP